MSEDLLGFDTDAQLKIIAAVGVVFVVAGQLMESSVGLGYHPTVFGIGLVMVLYAVGRFVWERLFG